MADPGIPNYLYESVEVKFVGVLMEYGRIRCKRSEMS